MTVLLQLPTSPKTPPAWSHARLVERRGLFTPVTRLGYSVSALDLLAMKLPDGTQTLWLALSEALRLGDELETLIEGGLARRSAERRRGA